MRSWLVLALIVPLLAGCTGSPDAPVDGLATPSDERGEPFAPVSAPSWKAGYRFRYESTGATSFSYDADTPEERESGSESEAWNDEPGLHYVVLNTTQTVDGEPAFIARAAAGDSPHDALLAIRASDLAMRLLGHAWLPCGPRDCALGGEAFSESGLRFPLTDGDAWTREPAHDERMAFGPGRFATEVLGEKLVQGPGGLVEAVHVRHLGQVDEQAMRDQLRQDLAASDEGEGIEDVEVEADVSSRRDLFYAPALRNVVLDRSEGSGRMVVSFVKEGRTWSYEHTFELLVVNRLVSASFDPTDEVPLGKLLEDTMTPPTWPEAFLAEPLELSITPSQANVFENPTIDIDAFTPGLWVDLTITDSAGDVVPFSEGDMGRGPFAHRPGGYIAFQPQAPGAYLVTATARGPDGALLQVRQGVIEAVYAGSTEASCPVVATGSCDELLLPMGPGLGVVEASVQVHDPLPVATPGELVLEREDGEVRAARSGDAAALVADGALWQGADWRLRYEPAAAVATGLTYAVSVAPAPDVLERMRAEAEATNDPQTQGAPQANTTAASPPQPVDPPAAPPASPAAIVRAALQRLLP